MMRSALRTLAIFGLLLQFLWPRYLFLSFAGKGVNPYTMATIALLPFALLVLLVYHPVQRRVLAACMNSGLLTGMFILLWGWRLLCDMVGIHAASSLGSTIMDFLYLGSWFVTGIIIFTDERTRSALPYVVAFSAIIATLCGIVEYRTSTPISQSLGFSSLAAGDTYNLNNIFRELSRAGEMRVRSLYSHPLVYGQMMAGLTPFAYYLMLHRSIGNKILGLISLLSIIASVILSNARSPMIIFAVATAVFGAFFLFDIRNRARFFLAIFLGAFGLFLLPMALLSIQQLSEGRTAQESSSSNARAMQWDRGTTALRDSPITGFGSGTADDYAGILGGADLTRVSVDNYYLTLAVESGYTGALFFILFLIAIFLQSFRTGLLRLPDNLRTLNCAAGATAVALGTGLTILSIKDTLSVIYVMAGLTIACRGEAIILARERGRQRHLQATAPSPLTGLQPTN